MKKLILKLLGMDYAVYTCTIKGKKVLVAACMTRADAFTAMDSCKKRWPHLRYQVEGTGWGRP